MMFQPDNAGKPEGLPLNRAMFHEGEPIEIIVGTFFICSNPWDSDAFESLTDAQANEFAARFMAPEYFFRTPKGIAVVKG